MLDKQQTIVYNNNRVKQEVNTMKKEFIASFQLSKKIIFNVDFYTLGNNSCPHFSTSVFEFNQPKTDYCSGGQAQEDLTKGFYIVRKFWKKWDKKHLQDLTEEEYADLIIDLEKMKQTYNYLWSELDEEKKPYNPRFSFSRMKELSKMKLSNTRNKAQGIEV